MRAVAYIRVSSVSQIDGHSLDAQEHLFGELCKNRSWEPVSVYREEGRSAHVEAITRRPEFKRLPDDTAKDRFDVVMVHTLDRWSRNLKVMLESLTTLGKHNVGLVSITENIDYSRPEGMLFTQMLGAFAQYFSESLGKHISKGLDQRAAEGGSIKCEIADEQVGRLIEAIELGPQWLEEILTIVSLKDEVFRINEERQRTQEKLRRMAKAYIDGAFPDEEYHRQKRLLEMELESLVVPKANAAEEAGKIIADLPRLWAGANEEEKRRLLLTMLDAVYVDAKEEKSIVAIKPKPPFRPIFEVATIRQNSDVILLKEPPELHDPEARCLWWRRGRVELPLKQRLVIQLLLNGLFISNGTPRLLQPSYISG